MNLVLAAFFISFAIVWGVRLGVQLEKVAAKQRPDGWWQLFKYLLWLAYLVANVAIGLHYIIAALSEAK